MKNESYWQNLIPEECQLPQRNQMLVGKNMTKSNKNTVEPYFKDDDETTLQNFPHIKMVQEEENCLDTHVRSKKLTV